MRVVFALAAAAAVVAVATPEASGETEASSYATYVKFTLRSRVDTNRQVAWRWQSKAGLRRSPTRYLERYGSDPYLTRLVHMWWRRAYHAMRVYHERHRVTRTLAVSHQGGYQTGVTQIGYANAYCESGGDPYNSHNSTYRGKWQFDQTTWDKFAPSAWKGHDPATVPESVQDTVAMSVTYDAWPNC